MPAHGDVLVLPEVILMVLRYGERNIVAQEKAVLPLEFLAQDGRLRPDDFFYPLHEQGRLAEEEPGINTEERLRGDRYVEHVVESLIDVRDAAHFIFHHNSGLQ